MSDKDQDIPTYELQHRRPKVQHLEAPREVGVMGRLFSRHLLPLWIFVALAGLLYYGMQLNVREVPSPLIGKEVPSFNLSLVQHPAQRMTEQELYGRVSLVNVWATWCVTCRAEHEVLNRLARTGAVSLFGINYKDNRNDAITWLSRLGDPYRASVFDPDGRVGIDWGVYGTPETFVIDPDGIIRYKHIGPLSQQDVDSTIVPLINEIKSEYSG